VPWLRGLNFEQLTVVGDFDAESEPVSNAHSLDLAASIVHDPDPWGRSLGGGSDADHLGVPVKT
jgi:hypothetical protein